MAKDNGATGPELGPKPNIHRQQDAKVGRKNLFSSCSGAPEMHLSSGDTLKREIIFELLFS
jgi:hypothetical protein